MLRILHTLTLLLVGLTVLAETSNADEVLDGTTDGGAFFRIVVPDVWNGDLAIWNHGFSLAPIGPVSDLGPLAAVQLAQGYAVAASSYQQTGWAVFKTKNDAQNMVNVFEANFGTPNNVLLTGASLGGIVSTTIIEKAHVGNLVGAFTFCGANAGSRNWDAALDLRLIYDAVCADVPTSFIPGGAEGLPAGSTRTVTDNVLSVHECLGQLLPPTFRTPSQVAHMATFLAVTQIPENFINTDIGFYVTLGMADLVHDPAKLDGRVGVTNIGVTYPDPLIDATIERVSPNNGAANRLRKNYTPKGDVGSVVHVALHTDKDGLVIVENQSEYASVAPASSYSVAVAVESVPTHCGNTAAEIVASWESLRSWVSGGPQPTAASIQGTCQLIDATMPLFPGPCRIDPAFVIPDMDGRVPPR
jgi:hypothetical protein